MQIKLKNASVSDLMSRAENFDLFFDREKAEQRAEEIKKGNKIAEIKKTSGKFIVFEFKKII